MTSATVKYFKPDGKIDCDVEIVLSSELWPIGQRTVVLGSMNIVESTRTGVYIIIV